MRPIVTLLTDFGTADGYVAEMKGVLLTSNRELTLIDIAHDVTPHDTEGARLAVARYWRRYPPPCVHLVVVDPGVGTDRAAIAVESDGRFLVGPDNGVLSPALLARDAKAVALEIPRTAAPTFHGRDVFAPAAAKLASGVGITALGRPLTDPVVRRTAEPRRLADGSVAGEVIHVDRFGNAITNLLTPHGGEIDVLGRTLRILRAYGDVAPGAYLALIGSSGLIEIARRDGDAAAGLGLFRGAPVVLRLPQT
jgi:S-adenosylmethionine hydrolase